MKRIGMIFLLTIFSTLQAGWWDGIQSITQPISNWYARLDSRSQTGVLVGGVALLGVGAFGLYWYISSQMSLQIDAINSIQDPSLGLKSRVPQDLYAQLRAQILQLHAENQCFPVTTIEYDGVIIVPVIDQRKREDLWPASTTFDITLSNGQKQHISLAEIKAISERTNCLYHALKNGIFGINAFYEPVTGIEWFKNMQDIALYQQFLIKSLEIVIPRREVTYARAFLLGRNAEEQEGFAVLAPGSDMMPFVPAECNKFGLNLKEHVLFIDRFAYYNGSIAIPEESLEETKRSIIGLTKQALGHIHMDILANYAFVVNTSAYQGVYEVGDAHWVTFLVHQNNGVRYVYYMDSLCPEDEGTLDRDIWAAARHEMIQGFLRLLGPVPHL